MERAAPDATELLHRYVDSHNRGVRSGDFDALARLFREDGVLAFDAIRAGPFRGPAAIRQAFRARPPDDELVLGDVTDVAGEAEATYAWRRDPAAIEGTLRLRGDRGEIAELRIARKP